MPDPLSVQLLNTIIETPTVSSWITIFLCLLTIAFFSGMEIAFISANKLRIELRSKQGVFGAKQLARYVKQPSEFISTVLVATNLSLVIYGMEMGHILEYYLDSAIHNEILKILTVTLISTFLVLITAEFIPKTLFKIQANKLIFAFSMPFRLMHLALWPLIAFTKSASSFLLRIFTKTQITEQTPVFSKVDLDNYISSIENSTNVESQEIDTEAFRNALDFSEVVVRDFMVPRTEIVSIDIDSSIEDLKLKFIETSHSRILVFKDSIDHIIGFVHHSDLFHNPAQIKNVLRPTLIANESLEAHDMLRNFIQQRKSLAIVVDEFGGTAGIATIEDVVEEIFGEIEDEFDTFDSNEQVLGENHYRFASRLEIDYLNEKYNFNLPEGEYNTLGGFIIYCSEKIPHTGETIRFDHFEFHITKMIGAKIDEVEMKLND
jgi:CBS domain containing-hemolysin-like protein